MQPGFTALLDELLDEGEEAFPRARQAFLFDHLGIAERLGPSTDPAHAAAEYERAATEAPVPRPAPAPRPAPLSSTEPAAIAGELGLKRLDLAGLAQARRNFARVNHPDRVPVHLKRIALVRMQIANAMIDEAEAHLAQG